MTILRALPYAFASLCVLAFVLFVHTHAGRVSPPERLLGIIDADTSVYYSCARQWWQDGGGLFYSSPYSTFKNTPRIYSHLGFMLTGAAWNATGVSIYTLDQTIRLVFGVAMFALAVALFRALLPRKERLTLIATLAAIILVCGGGLAWLLAILTSVQNTLILWQQGDLPVSPAAYFVDDYPSSFAQADEGHGDWASNLVRILPLAFECFYHTLFFGVFLCVVKRRYPVGVFLLFLAWWAHPFTGLEAGFILSAFLSVEVLLHRRTHPRRTMTAWIAALLVNVLFLAYYALYLPSFPEHAAVEHQMRDYPATMPLSMLLPAYGAFFFLLLPTAYLAMKRRWFRRPADRLMAIWTACVLFLIFHDRLLPMEFQPMHFTRGYLYFPMVYFSTRCLLLWVRNAPPLLRSRRTALALLLLAAHLPDTARLFLNTRPKLHSQREPFTMPESALPAIEALRSVPDTLSIYPLKETGLPESLVPLLTHHRTLAGHYYNTPHSKEKEADAALLEQDLSHAVMQKWRLDALLLPPREAERAAAMRTFEIRSLPNSLFLAIPHNQPPPPVPERGKF